MSSTEYVNTHGRARLSFATEADIDEFVSVLEQYERGEMTPDQWRAFRLVRGTYGQRQAADAQMLRVKVPQGVLTSAQLYALAEVGEKYSRRSATSRPARTSSSISSSCTTSSRPCASSPTRA
jgi:sulfite reductase beta subunit-like hemoprotein